MRVLLNWLDQLMERWTQSEYDTWFGNPESIKDIDKFLSERGWYRS